jgi:hypothetical protein
MARKEKDMTFKDEVKAAFLVVCRKLSHKTVAIIYDVPEARIADIMVAMRKFHHKEQAAWKGKQKRVTAKA